MWTEDLKSFFSQYLIHWGRILSFFCLGHFFGQHWQAVNGLVLASLTEEDLENMGVTKLLGCKVDLELGIFKKLDVNGIRHYQVLRYMLLFLLVLFCCLCYLLSLRRA